MHFIVHLSTGISTVLIESEPGLERLQDQKKTQPREVAPIFSQAARRSGSRKCADCLKRNTVHLMNPYFAGNRFFKGFWRAVPALHYEKNPLILI